MLKLSNISCGYGDAEVVSGLTMTVPAGKIVALLGPNGAGKSSTVMAIAGHVTLFDGSISFDGLDISHTSPMQRTRAGIGLAPEGRRIFADLTVAENLLVGGYVKSKAEAQVGEAEVLDLFPRLKQRYQQQAGTLSGGEQQMLAIGRALVARPRLLMIDELSLGLMPAMVELCFEAVEALKARGVGCLVVEQNTSKALAHADEVFILAAGRLVYSGPGGDAPEQADLVNAFLSIEGMEG